MVKRNRRDIAHTAEKQLSEKASTRSNPRTNIISDDVLVTLASAYENERARQVTEWERSQPHYLRRSA